LKAYPSILEVPGEVPLAVIAVNNKAVVSVVKDAGKKGVKAGVIFADGFAEGGEVGKQLQHELTDAAKAAASNFSDPIAWDSSRSAQNWESGVANCRKISVRETSAASFRAVE
jgi:hypothetical protein